MSNIVLNPIDFDDGDIENDCYLLYFLFGTILLSYSLLFIPVKDGLFNF